MNRFVIVSGLPASGKSTVARALADELALARLDKDDFLEARFEASGVGDAVWRRDLSRAADVDFRTRAEGSDGAVLTSWWRHPQSPDDSGTPTDWLARLDGPKVEVYCRCAPALAARRFVERRRHPGHGDGRWSFEELVPRFARQAALGPLGVGLLVEADTGSPIDGKELARQVGASLEADREA